MKKAILSVVAFEVQCPYCYQEVDQPYTGSLTWLVYDGDIPSGQAMAGQVVECDVCGKEFELPKRVSNNSLPTS